MQDFLYQRNVVFYFIRSKIFAVMNQHKKRMDTVVVRWVTLVVPLAFLLFLGKSCESCLPTSGEKVPPMGQNQSLIQQQDWS
jgi:hypothetical protein